MSRLMLFLVFLVLLAGCESIAPSPTPTAPPAETSTLPPDPSPQGPTPTLAVIDVPTTSTPVVLTATAGETPFAPQPEGALTGRLMTSLVGRPVQTPEGHALGTLVGLILERNLAPEADGTPVVNAAIVYGLLAAGEGLGLENRPTLPVPWEKFSVARFGSKTASDMTAPLALNVEPAVLTEAPSYPPNDLPDVSVPQWDAPVVTYWTENGAGLPVTGSVNPTQTPPEPDQTITPTGAPAETESPKETAVPATNASALLVRGKLAGLRAASPDGETLGVVEDLILDPVNGQIAYTVLLVEERAVIVPMTHIEWIAPPGENAPGVLYLRVPGEALQGAPTYETVEEISAYPSWEDDVQAYWSLIPPP